MKLTFNLMWRLGLVLVMTISLGLTRAIPSAAASGTATTTTSLASWSGNNTSTEGQPVTFTAAVTPGPSISNVTLNGAGANSPQTLYYQWFDFLVRQFGVKISYQGTGSGAGIQQITAGAVDFGATDVIMTVDEEKKATDAHGPVLHIPTAGTAVAIIYNLQGISSGQLKLTADVLAGIYLKNITNWNDPLIAAINPGVNLPNQPIAVVHRSDSSGTTFIFTDYLSKVSPAWLSGPGVGTAVNWPGDIGGTGSAGVAGQVQQVPNSIGYVELAYAIQNKLPWAAIKNAAGNYQVPSTDCVTAAAAGITLPDDMKIMVTNSSNPNAYPIASFTWMLVYVNQTDQPKGLALVKSLWWAVHFAQQFSPKFGYAALSNEAVIKAANEVLSIKYNGQPIMTSALTATGSVNFKDGSNLLSSVPLDNFGQCSYTTSNLPAGNRTISAEYSGDGNFSASTVSLTQTVNPVITPSPAPTPPPTSATPVPTTTPPPSTSPPATTTPAPTKIWTNFSLSSSSNPSVYGQPVTFYALNNNGLVPTGYITFKDDANVLGIGVITAVNGNGLAPLITSQLAVGVHNNITATYNGDANYYPCLSSPFSQTVGKANSVVTVANTPPSPYSQPITFSVIMTAAAPGSGIPTGTVQFKVDGTNLGTLVTLINGSATSSSISTLPVGTHTVTVVYNGDSNFNPSSGTATKDINAAATSSTALTSSVSPSVYGQPVTYTAMVTSTGGTPTGTVTFGDGNTAMGTGTLNGSGAATFSSSTLAAGAHTVTAVYAGDTNFPASTSNSISQIINKSSTIVTATSSSTNNTAAFGQSVTFTAAVSAVAPGTGSPHGNIQFTRDGNAMGSPVLLNGSGSAAISAADMTIGSHNISAIYTNTDDNYENSTSTALTQIVNQAAPTITLVSSFSPSVFGQSITFTASVTGFAYAWPTGVVVFKDGTTTLGNSPLNGSGLAGYTTSTLTAGSHSITAIYMGDGNYTSVTTTALSQTVNQAALVSASLTANPLTSIYGQPVTFTATLVAQQGTPLPTGTVTFKDGNTALGTGSLNSSGAATYTTSALTAGNHTINAVYAGDTNYASVTLTISGGQIVNKAPTNTVLVSLPDPSVYGQSVTWTATISSSVSSSIGIPTGTVTFKDGDITLGTGTLNNSGAAAFSNSTLVVGNHSMAAIYGGDANFTDSTSVPFVKQVNTASTTVVVAASMNPAAQDQPVTFTATVSTLAPGRGTPNGIVKFLDNGNSISGAILLNSLGAATFSTSSLAVGIHNITAIYTHNSEPVNFNDSFSILSVEIRTKPAIDPFGDIPLAEIGTTFAFSVTASNGTIPYTWSLTAGSTLPAGLQMSASGAITGTPTGPAGTTTVMVKVTDVLGGFAAQSLTIQVISGPVIVTTSLPSGAVEYGYPWTQIMATGGTTLNNGGYLWSIPATGAGSLPVGLTFDSNIGAVFGIPQVAGTSTVQVTVTDARGSHNTASLPIVIHAGVTISTTSLPAGDRWVPYSYTLHATGGNAPYNWTWGSGQTIPPGLGLTNDGIIRGAPNAIGLYNFPITVFDSAGGNDTAIFSLTVCGMPTITSTLLPATVGIPYNATLQASGGVSPYTWSVPEVGNGTLPAGLSLNSTTGAISGTLQAAGTYGVSLTVTDHAGGNFTGVLSLTVNPNEVVVSTPTLPSGQVGTAYSGNLQATGGVTPYTWSLSGTLPAGLTLNAATGAISGTPTAAGTSNISVTVTDSIGGSASASLSITVAQVSNTLTISTVSLADGTVNTAYSVTLQAAGGTSPFTWSLTSGTWPASLSLNATTGAITGTPTAAGTANLTLKVTDNVNATATKALTLTINQTASSNSSFTIPLAQGWNLISLPLIPANSSITSLFTGISNNVVSIWSYEAATAKWSSWNPALGGDLSTMVDGKGYWVNMSATAALTGSGTAVPAPPAAPPTYSVSSGWNLIGFKGTGAKTNTDYLNGTSYQLPIFAYSSGAYTNLAAGDQMRPNVGYWVYFNAAGTINP